MKFWDSFAQKHPAAAQWVREGGLFVPDFICNIGTTVLNGGVSMVVFFFVNRIIFPVSN